MINCGTTRYEVQNMNMKHKSSFFLKIPSRKNTSPKSLRGLPQKQARGDPVLPEHLNMNIINKKRGSPREIT
jgi:hypothetical protein